MNQDISKKRYIIYGVPERSANAGVRVLYMLREELERRGYEALIYQHRNKYKNILPEKCYIRHLTKEIRNTDIIIYPEVIYGNPLGFRNVVRYVLNVPGFLAGDKEYHDSELVFSWNKSYLDNVPLLKFDLIDTSLFYKTDEEKDICCFFVHKGGKCRDIPELKDCTEITMTWPETREELAALLRRTKILYSYDDNSSLLEEAHFCGSDVKIVKEDCIEDFVCKYDFDKDIFEKQITDFIKLTQEMNYTGELNKNGYISLATYYFNKTSLALLGIVYIITRIKKIKLKRKLLKHRLLR